MKKGYGMTSFALNLRFQTLINDLKKQGREIIWIDPNGENSVLSVNPNKGWKQNDNINC